MAGKSLAWYDYYPYEVARSGGADRKAPTNPFRFTGEHLDGVTGLYHLRACQSDPALGRFLSLDPVAVATAGPYVASYVYVRKNPCTYVDPSGMVREGPSDFLDPNAQVLVCKAGQAGIGIGLIVAGAALEVASGLAIMGSGGTLTPAAAVSITVGALDIPTTTSARHAANSPSRKRGTEWIW